MTISLGNLALKLAMGIFDEVSDWLYFFTYDSRPIRSGFGYSSESIRKALIFFLVG